MYLIYFAREIYPIGDGSVLVLDLNGQYVYFVHSYQAFCNEENISAQCEYDGKIPALVWNGGTVYGAQFHPEKSGSVGLDILKNFGGLVK